MVPGDTPGQAARSVTSYPLLLPLTLELFFRHFHHSVTHSLTFICYTAISLFLPTLYSLKMEPELKEPNQITQPGILSGSGRDIPAYPTQQVQIESPDVRADVQGVDYIEENVQSRVPKPLVSLSFGPAFIPNRSP